MRVVDHDRLLATVNCLFMREETHTVTLRIIAAATEEIIACRGTTYSWEPSIIDFGKYSVRASPNPMDMGTYPSTT
jgi:hypothetical protein